MIRSLFFSVVFAISLQPAAFAQDPIPYGQSRLGLSDEGRDGTLYIPKSYKPGTKMPLLIMLQGFSGWGDNQRSLFALAEELGFIVVTPESRDITWGKEAPGFDQDVRYIGAAFRHAGSIVNIDFDRVALGGQSDGMRWMLHAPEGGGLIEPIRRQGKPKIFFAHGVKDSTMPIDVSGRKNVALLKQEGYDVTYHEHDGGHGTPREIVREAIEWFLGKPKG